jgi:hypothetical protein
MENLTDSQLWELLTSNQTAIFITCIGLLLVGLSFYLAISNFKQIARMKVDYEEHINKMKEFNEKKTFK